MGNEEISVITVVRKINGIGMGGGEMGGACVLGGVSENLR